MSEQNKIAEWKGRFSAALGNPSTNAWLAGGGTALLAYMLSGGNKKLKKNPLMRLLLSGGAGLAAVGGVNAWDRYKARKAPAPPQETSSAGTDAIQEAANTSAAMQEQQQPSSTQQPPQETFSDDTEATQEQDRASTPAKELTDKERLEQRYGYLPILHAQEWVEDASKVSRYATPAIGAVGGWFAGGALDNKFMKADGVYRGNPYVAPKTRLGKMVEHIRNPAYSAAQGVAKGPIPRAFYWRDDAGNIHTTGRSVVGPFDIPKREPWVESQKDATMGTGNIVRGAVARGAGAGAGALIGAGIDKYIANPLLSAARRYLLRK